MLRKKVFLYVSFVKSVQFVCAIIQHNKTQSQNKTLNKKIEYLQFHQIFFSDFILECLN